MFFSFISTCYILNKLTYSKQSTALMDHSLDQREDSASIRTTVQTLSTHVKAEWVYNLRALEVVTGSPVTGQMG